MSDRDDILRAIAAKEDVEDWRGVSGMPIGYRNGNHQVHNSTANLLEEGGLVEVRIIEYVATERRVFLTPRGKARIGDS